MDEQLNKKRESGNLASCYASNRMLAHRKSAWLNTKIIISVTIPRTNRKRKCKRKMNQKKMPHGEISTRAETFCSGRQLVGPPRCCESSKAFWENQWFQR